MITAYFLINVILGSEMEVIEKIKNILDEAEAIDYEIQGVYGVFDIIVKVSAESDDRIRYATLEKIKEIDRIKTTTTILVNKELK